MKRLRRFRKPVRMFFILVVGVFLASPLLYLVSGSLMSSAQLTQFPPAFFPSSIHWSNFTAAWDYLHLRAGVNSIVFTVVTVTLQWSLCVSSGFVLAKMHFRASRRVVALLGLSLFVPTITTLVPTFVVTDKLHLINTYPGLILPIVAQTGFGTLLFRQYIVSLPTELVDAARVDGAKWMLILRRVIIPLALPATGAYAAISVLTAWNMYLWPLVAATKPSVSVLTESLAPLAETQYGGVIPESVAFAATLITTLPMIVAFLAAQKTFIKGIQGSGVE